MSRRPLPPLPRALLGVACLALSAAGRAAAPMPLDDEQLAGVRGADGISLNVHLELNSGLLTGGTTENRIVLGFDNGGVKTYAVLQNLAGIADFYNVNVSMRERVPGDSTTDYFDIKLPDVISFQQFGVHAIAATTSPDAPVTTANGYGSLLLNGTMNVQGHFYLWPKP